MAGLLTINRGLVTPPGGRNLITTAGGAPCCCGSGGGNCCNVNQSGPCVAPAALWCCGNPILLAISAQTRYTILGTTTTASGSAVFRITRFLSYPGGPCDYRIEVVTWGFVTSRGVPDPVFVIGCNFRGFGGFLRFGCAPTPMAIAQFADSLIGVTYPPPTCETAFLQFRQTNCGGSIFDPAGVGCSGSCIFGPYSWVWQSAATGGTGSMSWSYRDASGSQQAATVEQSASWNVVPVEPCEIPGCTPIGPPSRLRGACCLPDGGCAVTSSGACASIGGAYHGDGSICATVHCPPAPSWACCLPGGGCAHLTQAECLAMSGTWASGRTCPEVNCSTPLIGACCFEDAFGTVTCSLQTGADCATQGGTYHGDGTQCGNIACQGACCMPTSHGRVCALSLSGGACAAASGIWLGYGSTCGPPDPCQNASIRIATGAETLAVTGGCSGCGKDAVRL